MATPTVCYPVVRGRVARFTRVDDCGCPTPGPCNTIVTEDIVGITLSPEVEEGEEITVRNMAGKLCISDKPCDTIKWYNVEITMCKQIPALYSLMAGYTTAHDRLGQIVGFGIASNVDCTGGFAMELWGDTPGQACVPGAAAGQWDYLVVPWISAATMSGDIEIGNSARQQVLSGRTKTGHCWGSGPYAVEIIDSNNTCGPLVEPIPPEMHVWDLLVGCPPPASACECIPSYIFCEAGLSLVDNLGVPSEDGTCARIRWNAVGPVTIKYYAAMVAIAGPAKGDGIHCYTGAQADPGTLNVITIALAADPLQTCTTEFLIPNEPTIDGEALSLEADAIVDNNSRPVIIDWGDGTATSTNAGDGVAVTSHTYAVAGTYTVKICDSVKRQVCTFTDVVVPF